MTRSEKQVWESVRARGRNRFVIGAGIISLGLPFATAMALLDLGLRFAPGAQPKPVWQVSTGFAFLTLFFGLVMGEFAWRMHEKEYSRPLPAGNT